VLGARVARRRSDARRAQNYSGRAAVLSRPARPPPYGCFTVPRLELLPALEALLQLLFANLFWVGLWDLLDNTIFPDENSIQMISLARAPRLAPGEPLSARRALSGAALATVVGVLVEVPFMLVVVRAVNRSKDWYERGLTQSPVRPPGIS
jgi:hypothetical protein